VRAHKSLLKQYGTPLWFSSDGKIIHLLSPEKTKGGKGTNAKPGWLKGGTKGAAPKLHKLEGMVIRAAADPMAKPDGEHLLRFMRALHEQAARAIGDAERPGYLQISVNIPDTKSWIPTRYKIGDVDECVRAATDYANSRHNVYIEARTIRPETRPGERGDTEDTAWVVAFVIDSDADKGKGFALGEIQPTLTVESSPGNAHHWFFLEKAIPADDVAKRVGDAMRKVWLRSRRHRQGGTALPRRGHTELPEQEET
jgi:hypothetical protein